MLIVKPTMTVPFRDAWFEVPLPFFLRDNDIGLGWSRSITGLFLAVFIIVYGQVQSWSPQLILGPLRQAPANKNVALLWAALLAVLPTVLGPVILTADVFQEHHVDGMTAILVVRASYCMWRPAYAINMCVSVATQLSTSSLQHKMSCSIVPIARRRRSAASSRSRMGVRSQGSLPLLAKDIR